MTRKEILFLKLMEESAEINHRVSKGLRFGLDHKKPGTDKTNKELLRDEIIDFVCILTLIEDEGYMEFPIPSEEEVEERAARIEKYLEVSKEQGTLTE